MMFQFVERGYALFTNEPSLRNLALLQDIILHTNLDISYLLTMWHKRLEALALQIL